MIFITRITKLSDRFDAPLLSSSVFPRNDDVISWFIKEGMLFSHYFWFENVPTSQKMFVDLPHTVQRSIISSPSERRKKKRLIKRVNSLNGANFISYEPRISPRERWLIKLLRATHAPRFSPRRGHFNHLKDFKVEKKKLKFIWTSTPLWDLIPLVTHVCYINFLAGSLKVQ